MLPYTWISSLSNAYTPPSGWYTDPDMLPLEKQHIFRRTWQFAASLEKLVRPGDFLAVDILNEIPVVLVRDGEGRLRGFYNVCRHRAGHLAEGHGNRRSLQCRYHGWTYSLEGDLLNTPGFDGVQDFDPAQFCLAPIRLETWGPFAFVNFDTQAPSLADWLGQIPQDIAHLRFGQSGSLANLVPIHRRDYYVEANWKVYIDNYLEGYHVPIVHPGLFRELDYAKYRVKTFRYYSSQIAPIRPWRDGEEGKRIYAQTGDDQAFYYWIFPNFMLNIYMGSIQINVIVPLSPARTLTIFEWYYPTDFSPADWDQLQGTIKFSDQIQQEDIQVCQEVWRGLCSGAYTQGRYAPMHENGVHHFHGLLSEYFKD